MKQVSDSEWVISLYDYDHLDTQSLIMRFSNLIFALFDGVGIEVTHYAAEAPGFTGRLQRATEKSYGRLLNTKFEKTRVLSLSSIPKGSKGLGFDRVASASISFVPVSLDPAVPHETLMVFALNEAIATFSGSEFMHILSELVKLNSWSSGYAFIDRSDRNPEIHALVCSNGYLTANEEEMLNRWYSAPANVKMARARSVYPFNLLNKQQLAQITRDGRSLSDYIESKDTLTSIEHLSLWSVPIEKLNERIEDLRGSQAIVG